MTIRPRFLGSFILLMVMSVAFLSSGDNSLLTFIVNTLDRSGQDTRQEMLKLLINSRFEISIVAQLSVESLELFF